MYDVAIELYVEICQFTIPISIVFGIGDLIVRTLLDAALGGRLWMRKSS